MTSERDAIELVLRNFCAAMNLWEMEMNEVERRKRRRWPPRRGSLPDSDPYWKERNEGKQRLREIFKQYCTTWENPGRGVSFGQPPSYQPEYFEVLEVNIRGTRARAKVRQRDFIFDAEEITYFLRLTSEGWRLEDRRTYLYDIGKGACIGRTTL